MRKERDSLGEMTLPEGALWGVHTARAVENLPLSGQTIPRPFVKALAQVKQAAAETNLELGFLNASLGDAIVKACKEMAGGLWDDQMVVDPFQGGQGPPPT